MEECIKWLKDQYTLRRRMYQTSSPRRQRDMIDSNDLTCRNAESMLRLWENEGASIVRTSRTKAYASKQKD
jgi:hypothetical protein